jgi:hypothetical protein
MKFISNIIKKLIQKELPKPLGRWRMEDCNNKINSKIDLSNEDHCGPCGQYVLDKINFKDIKTKKYVDNLKNNNTDFKN